MIQSFLDADTQELFEKGRNKRWRGIEKVARRKLDMIAAAAQVIDLRIPPGNKLEALRGDREGQFSIRINEPYRVCFTWKDDGAHDVEVAGYH